MTKATEEGNQKEAALKPSAVLDDEAFTSLHKRDINTMKLMEAKGTHYGSFRIAPFRIFKRST